MADYYWEICFLLAKCKEHSPRGPNNLLLGCRNAHSLPIGTDTQMWGHLGLMMLLGLVLRLPRDSPGLPGSQIL